MSRLNVNQILQPASGFRLFHSVGRDEVQSFSVAWLSRRSLISLAYFLLVAAAFIFLIYAAFHTSLTRMFWSIPLGAIIAVGLFIPLHELTHALGYLLIGARDIRFFFNPRKLYAYAAANHFVMSGGELSFVALLPTFMLNPLLLLLAYFFPSHVTLIAAIIFIHTLGAGGDFAIANFLNFYRRTHQPQMFYDHAQQRIFYLTRLPITTPQ